MIKEQELIEIGFTKKEDGSFQKEVDMGHVIEWHDYKIININIQGNYRFRIRIRSVSSWQDETEQVFLGRLTDISQLEYIINKVI